uniref:Cysteine-rich protein 1 n=1 Tax=Sinocyclocheilus anshuiensis TaxID=1608454 RepID=A0A671LA81_9TELE
MSGRETHSIKVTSKFLYTIVKKKKSSCPRLEDKRFWAEKVSSLGKDWHKFCLKCERCSKTLTAGGHAEHDGKPYCHKPCYAALFGPKGVNIGGAGSYVYEAPTNPSPPASTVDSAPKPQEKWVPPSSRPPSKAGNITTFSGEANLCPRCNKKVYFAEKVTSLGKDWHRPCLRCERCSKTLAAGSHAEHKDGVNTGGVGSYIYDKEPNTEAQP